MKTKTSFKKGEAKGKPKGALNHTTKDIKEAYRLLVENNLDNMQTWITKIAAKNPERAINIIISLSEYIVPKLARTELSGNVNDEQLENNKVIIEVIHTGYEIAESENDIE